MQKYFTRFLVVCLIVSYLTEYSVAQKNYGGIPESISDPSIALKLGDVPVIDLANKTKAFLKKSKNSLAPNIIGLPLFEKGEASQFLKPDGFTVLGDTRTYIEKITLGGASESYIRFRNLILPKGSRLFLLNTSGDQVFGAYTHLNNNEKNTLMVGPIQGDVIIEYNSPKGIDSKKMPFTIDQIYVNPQNYGAEELGFGAAFDCQININCDEGRSYNQEKNGIVRIRMVAEEGIALCSGTLLNNTSDDDTPYVLSAFHCEKPANFVLTPLYDMWYFDFGYQSSSCANPSEEPTFISAQGCEKLSSKEDTDMLLLKITGEIPAEANAYFNGWDRRDDYLPSKTAMIHHPAGDIMKITQDFDPVEIHEKLISWNNGTVTSIGSHYINDFDDAVYQPGSSGAPLFDEVGRVIGQLHGGPLSDKFCTVGIGYSGRLSLSWDGASADSRLKDWLDPQNTGAQFIDGKIGETELDLVEFQGRVITADGIAIPNVSVDLTGDKQNSFFTGADGRFVFDNLSTKGNYNLILKKDTNHGNGLTAIDLVLMRNHIIGKKVLPGVFQQFAADVSQDGNISSIDLVQIMNVIIGRSERFSSTDSWKFEPENLEMSGNTITELEFTVIGYKMGDLNNSANPRN